MAGTLNGARVRATRWLCPPCDLRSIVRHCERSEAIQTLLRSKELDCFVASAPRNDELKQKWPGFLPAIFMS
jgi:hypothetical protein